MIVLAFLALIPRFLFGLLFVRLIWKPRDFESRIIQIFLAAPIGIGVSSLMSFLWIWANLDLRVYAIGETIGVGVVLAITMWNQKSTLIVAIKHFQQSLTEQPKGWLILLGLATVICIGEFWVQSIQNPNGLWDAWENWNVGARFVYRGGDEWTGTFRRISLSSDYPLLLPIANATTWEVLPKETNLGPAVLAFVFTISIGGLLYGLIGKLRDPRQASLAGVVLVSQPILVYWGMSQYADVPLAYYMVASTGLLLIYLQTKDKPIPILAGITVGLAAWTKNEGVSFVLISSIAWISIGWFQEKTAIRNFLIGLAFPLLVVILFKINLAPADYLFTGGPRIIGLLMDDRRYFQILKEAGIYFWNIGGGPISIVVLLVIYTGLVGKTKYPIKGMPLILFIVTSQLLAYFFIYLITPLDLLYQINNSMDRLYLHVFPTMILGLFLWLKSPKEFT